MDKTCTIADIVGAIESGMTLGIGGWGARRKPMAVIRELLQTDVRELTIISYGGPDVGMLASAEKIAKLVFGFVSMDLVPLEPHFRAARQAGAFQVMEIDEGMLQLGLKAAASRLPFLPTRVGFGSDVLTANPEIKTITSPYADGEILVAMPALPIDVAICHVNEADALGNSRISGPDPFFDEWLCRAAGQAFLTTEALVDTEAFNDPPGGPADADRAVLGGRRRSGALGCPSHVLRAKVRHGRGASARLLSSRQGRLGGLSGTLRREQGPAGLPAGSRRRRSGQRPAAARVLRRRP